MGEGTSSQAPRPARTRTHWPPRLPGSVQSAPPGKLVYSPKTVENTLSNIKSAQTKEEDAFLSCLLREGGERLYAYLLNQAIPAYSTPYQYKDILQMPPALQKEWKTACDEEIKAIKHHNIFGRLVDLPSGCKTIKFRWVFTTKSDGRKKARLVAKGYSQIEGINYNEIFSPVIRYESV
jgi:hypothetical protein